MKLHKESHLDHGLTARQLAHILFLFETRDAFFIETIELPEELGTVPCGLYGPIMGDDAICDDRVAMVSRGTRTWQSRVLPMLAGPRQVRTLTVVAGPHEETCTTCDGKLGDGPGLVIGCDHCGGSGKLSHACILHTAYGGPAAPQEPGDLRGQLEAAETTLREYAPGQVDGGDQDATLLARVIGLRGKLEESDTFWRDHALSD